jgi:oligo-alginate lyase
MIGFKNILLVFFGQAIALTTLAQSQHPSIMLTKKNVEAVTRGVTEYPLLQSSFNDVRACIAYQITKDKKYADFVKNILLEYASQYEKWPLHPKRRTTNAAGRIFWQTLNDCVWQVYVIQGYDLVYDYLSAQDKNTIEQKLFVPIVKFLSEDNAETFNRIHNHGTWAVAAVGMTGYVVNRKDWVERALKGSNKDGKSGYLAQLNQLFSPDGYYTEGPYYQRYALLPFIVFGRAIQQYQPELKIYNARNGVLSKAIYTCLQLTYTNGALFPVNDAMKDKTFESEELVYGVDIAYADIAGEPDLLDVAKHQQRVIISDAGLKVAADIKAGKAKPFAYRSMWVKDGEHGDEGGLGILRAGSNADQQCVLLKAASQGMGHGHFDRLNFLYYDKGGEIFSDYGAARFLNIETKSGGDYLPENKSWAKQTVAHNTVVVDKTSDYKADVDKAQGFHPELIYFNDTKGLEVVSAKEEHAYEGVKLTRTLAIADVKGFDKPLVIDVFKVQSNKEHQYDLPYWYQGQITNTPFTVEVNKTKLEPLGNDNGYQHIWLNAKGQSNTGTASITFLQNNRFYTTSFLADTTTQVQFVNIGANDPNFNLRNEKGFIISTPHATNHTFVSLIESHGNTNPTAETTSGFMGKITSIKMLTDKDDITSFQFSTAAQTYTVTINYNNKQSFITIK